MSKPTTKPINKFSPPVRSTYQQPYTSLRPTGTINTSRALSSLTSRGIISSSGNTLTLSKPLSSLTNEDIQLLNVVGFNITTSQRNTAKRQQDELDTLKSHGVITQSGDQFILSKPLYDISGQDLIYLKNMGFNITQQQESQRAYVVYLRNKGVITTSKGQLAINPNATLSSSDKQKLESLGFAFSTKTSTDATRFTPSEIETQNKRFQQALAAGEITQAQYNQAMAVQNVNLQANQILLNDLQSRGLVKKVPVQGLAPPGSYPITPESYGYQYQITNLNLLTDKDIIDLRSVGFNISPDAKNKIKITQDLIGSGTVKMVGNSVVLNKPITTLTDAEVNKLGEIGFDKSKFPIKGPSGYLLDVGKQGGILGVLTGQKAQTPLFVGDIQRKQKLEMNSALLGSFVEGLTAVVNLGGIIGLPTLQFRGPTGDTLKYYDKYLTPEQVSVARAGGIGAAALGSYFSMVPVGYAAKSVMTVAKSVAVRLSETGMAQSVAKNLGIAVSKIPSSQLTSKLAAKIGTLMTNPKVQQAMVWTSIGGGESVNVIIQLSQGKPIDDILWTEGKNVAMLIAGMKGFRDGMQMTTRLDKYMPKESDRTVLQRATKIEGIQTRDGTKLVLTVDEKALKGLSKEGAELLHTYHDPVSGKTVLVGIGKSEGMSFPFKLEMDNAIWADFFKSKTLSPEQLKGAILKWVKPEDYYKLLQQYPDLSKLSTQQLFDLVSNYTGKEFANLTTDQLTGMVSKVSKLTSMSEKQASKFIFEHPEVSKIIQSKIDTIASGYPKEMTEKQLLDALYKELNQGPLSQSMDLIVREVRLKDLKSFSMDLRAAFQTTDRDFIKDLYTKLTQAGVTDSKASYLTSHILSSDVDTTAGVLKSLKLTGSQAADIMALRIEAGGPTRIGDTAIFKALKAGGVSEKEIPKVIETYVSGKEGVSSILSSGIPKMSQSGVKAVTDMLGTQTLSNLKLAPEALSRIVTVMPEQTVASFATTLAPTVLAALSAEAVTHSMIAMTPDQVNIVLQNTSPNDMAKMIPKINTNTLNNVVSKLDIGLLSNIIVSLTPDQLNSVIPTLTTEQFSSVIQALDIPPNIIQQYLQTGQVPKTSNISPLILQKLMDEHVKRSKKIAKEKPTYFKVKLFYKESSQQFKIRAKTFRGATYTALQRRKEKELPLEVTVQKVGADVEQL